MPVRTPIAVAAAMAWHLACAPSPEARTSAARHAAVAVEAEAAALGCARDLELLAPARPEAVFGVLEPELAVARLHLLAAGREPLVRRDLREIGRRLRAVKGLRGAVTRLAAEPGGVALHLEVGAMAEQARLLSSRLCGARDALAVVARQAPLASQLPERQGEAR